MTPSQYAATGRARADGEGKATLNLRRGLFRLWLIASAIWIAAVAWVTYVIAISPRLIAVAETKCFEASKRATDGRNPFDCFHGTGMKFDDLTPLWTELAPFIAAALAPVFFLLLMGLAGFWVAAGFRHRKE